MTTSVPPPTFTPTGLEIPEESAILAGVQGDFNDAFGGDLNPALETPQGQLASSITDIVATNNTLFAEFVNQVNPDTADGFMQDAIARIYYLERAAGAPTVVVCQLSGANGTVIPIGAQAADTSGNRYVSIDAGVIASGTLTLSFQGVIDGPTPCPSGTLTSIFQGISGWDSITNAADGVPGHLVEAQADFAFRRQQSVALNAHGSLDSIYGAVFDVAGVLDVYVTENRTASVVNTGATDYPMAAHSLLVSVTGGDSDDIAAAIWSKKDVGCNYNGNTTVTVTDVNGYALPYPAYEVTFLRPDPLPILFEATLQDNPSLPGSITADVKAAILATFAGTDGRPRARIGAEVLASNFYAGLLAISPSVAVITLLCGTVTADSWHVESGIDQQPTLDEADITVVLA